MNHLSTMSDSDNGQQDEYAERRSVGCVFILSIILVSLPIICVGFYGPLYELESMDQCPWISQPIV